MSKINLDLLLNLSSVYTYGLNERDLDLSLRRLKRVFNLNNFEPNNFEDTEEIVDYLLHKYSVPTIIQTIQTIVILSDYYACKNQVSLYLIHLENIIDMKTNSHLYSKINISDIDLFINKNYKRFLNGEVCFSKFRHFTLLTLLINEIPLRYPTLTNIKYQYHNFIDKEDCLEHDVYLIKKKDEFFFIFNKKNKHTLKQIEYKITNQKTRMLLKQYFAKYANNLNYLFTTSSGRKCSESNLANALSNFCRLFLDVPLTLGELRKEWIKYPRTDEQIYIFKNF